MQPKPASVPPQIRELSREKNVKLILYLGGLAFAMVSVPGFLTDLALGSEEPGSLAGGAPCPGPRECRPGSHVIQQPGLQLHVPGQGSRAKQAAAPSPTTLLS